MGLAIGRRIGGERGQAGRGRLANPALPCQPESSAPLRGDLDRDPVVSGAAGRRSRARHRAGGTAGSGAGEISGPANLLYGLVFEATRIQDMGLRFADGSALSMPDTVVRRSYLANRESIETAMVGTQLLGVRFATFMRFLPLLLLLYAVGTVDGLTERAIRRSCGGRESASLYHRAKYLQMAVLGLGGVALLVWPGPVAWELCAGLIVVVTGGLARQQWAFYKKHL